MAEDHVKRIAKLIAPLRVEPGTKVTLAKDFDPASKAGFLKKADGEQLLQEGVALLAEYQARLAAQDTWGMLVCLQALDAGGKDGAIRHVLSGINPQGVHVSEFKVPSAEELNHDYLWRYAQRLPGRGEIGIFNRSHYEEVLVVRVHPEILDRQNLPAAAKGKGVWERRYQEINDWEHYLSDNGFKVVKLFLNLSREQQRIRGDPTEGAFLVLAHKAGLDVEGTRARFPRLATLPFDPTYKLMAVFATAADASGNEVVRCFVKGAAPAVMARCTSASSVGNGESSTASAGIASDAQEHIERMEGEGLRVMAGATRDIAAADFDPAGDLLSYVTGLERASLVGMIDPPREESKAAVAAAQAAHIQVRMVTGDDVITGAAIAEKLGIPGEAILGADFAALSEAEQLSRIDGIGVVGRVAPEHKVLLVETLRKKGHVVAMTGDGVNDAPAIKAADIGIAMGSGTEVAKNAGRMILSDDNFATIVFAIEQGRMLYDNLMKYVRFILITLVAFIAIFLGATLLNIAAGQPFNPVQILWINFLIDMPLGIALGFDLETPGLMKRLPRPRKQGIVNIGVIVLSLLTGVFMAVTVLALIHYGTSSAKSATVGVTLALSSFALFRIVCTFQSRSIRDSAFRLSTFDCRQINLISLGEIVLTFLATEVGVLNRLLGTTPLSGDQWLLAIAPAIALFLLWELGKLIVRARSGAPVSTADA